METWRLQTQRCQCELKSCCHSVESRPPPIKMYFYENFNIIFNLMFSWVVKGKTEFHTKNTIRQIQQQYNTLNQNIQERARHWYIRSFMQQLWTDLKLVKSSCYDYFGKLWTVAFRKNSFSHWILSIQYFCKDNFRTLCVIFFTIPNLIQLI